MQKSPKRIKWEEKPETDLKWLEDLPLADLKHVCAQAQLLVEKNESLSRPCLLLHQANVVLSHVCTFLDIVHLRLVVSRVCKRMWDVVRLPTSVTHLSLVQFEELDYTPSYMIRHVELCRTKENANPRTGTRTGRMTIAITRRPACLNSCQRFKGGSRACECRSTVPTDWIS